MLPLQRHSALASYPSIIRRIHSFSRLHNCTALIDEADYVQYVMAIHTPLCLAVYLALKRSNKNTIVSQQEQASILYPHIGRCRIVDNVS